MTAHHPDDTDARAALARGNALFHSADWRASRPEYERALTAFENAGDVGGAADALCNLAGFRWRTSDLDGAAELYDEARDRYVSIEAWWHVATVEQYLGNVAWHRGDLHRGRWYYERARLGLTAVGRDPRDVAALDVTYAGLLGELGEHDRAFDLLDEAAVLYRSVLDDDESAPALAEIDQNRGVVLHLRGDSAMAWRYLARALRTQRALGDRTKVADLLHDLANVARAWGRGPTAIALYRATITAYESAGDEDTTSADSRLGLAGQLLRDGDNAGAAAELQAAIVSYTATGEWLALARAVSMLGSTRPDGSPEQLDDLVPALLAMQSVTWGLPETTARARWHDTLDHAVAAALASAVAGEQAELVAELIETMRSSSLAPTATPPAGISINGRPVHDLPVVRPPLINCGWPPVLDRHLQRAEELRNASGTALRLRSKLTTVTALLLA